MTFAEKAYANLVRRIASDQEVLSRADAESGPAGILTSAQASRGIRALVKKGCLRRGEIKGYYLPGIEMLDDARQMRSADR